MSILTQTVLYVIVACTTSLEERPPTWYVLESKRLQCCKKYLQVWDAFDLRVAGQVEVLLCLKDTLCSPDAMLIEDQTMHKVSEVEL